MMVVLLAALMTGVPVPGTLRAFHPGMTADEARVAAGCRLKRPPGRHRADELTCSRYEFGGVRVKLSLRFRNGLLSEVSLYRGGLSEKRMRRDTESVLQALSREFGTLSSPELGGRGVDADAVFTYLKGQRTYAATSNLTAKPAIAPGGIDVTARVSSARSAAPTVPIGGLMTTYDYLPGAAPSAGGSPFDLVHHSIEITVRAPAVPRS